MPFADTTIPVSGATELAVFKAFFNRTKDWADIRRWPTRSLSICIRP